MRYDLTACDDRLKQALLPETEKKARVKVKKALCRPSSPLFMAGGALFAVIACSGLFLGFFLPSSVGTLIAGGETILRGSLLGVLVEILRGSIAPPAMEAGMEGAIPLSLYLSCLVLGATVLLSAALAAAAFVRINAARALCNLNGTLVVSAYGTLFLLGALGGVSDPASAIPFFCAAGLLSLLAVLRRGAEGVFRFFLLICSLLGAGAFLFSGTSLRLMADRLSLSSPGIGGGLLLALLGLLALNIFLSVLLCGSRGGWWDILRFALQTVCAISLAAYGFATEGVVFFTDGPIACVLLLLPPIACFFLAVVCRPLFPHKQRPKKEKDGAAADPS